MVFYFLSQSPIPCPFLKTSRYFSASQAPSYLFPLLHLFPLPWCFPRYGCLENHGLLDTLSMEAYPKYSKLEFPSILSHPAWLYFWKHLPPHTTLLIKKRPKRSKLSSVLPTIASSVLVMAPHWLHAVCRLLLTGGITEPLRLDCLLPLAGGSGKGVAYQTSEQMGQNERWDSRSQPHLQGMCSLEPFRICHHLCQLGWI